ncbi:MAG: ribosomal protein S18-alanine N-acetyltransferase [Steroidobacteraceae bacterium]|nr:ribosomal protein S18-alanine N-acetyltransferase [Nevskiaceae bacterium]MCP5359554.1 ribosomal protein S18-alanine N-acetyltransferase [Nevskiaceae bacterium]MCP5473046.1 ribosomal protein S18-alanine N-acetyltransferase [Nevskiaceae bacterium]
MASAPELLPPAPQIEIRTMLDVDVPAVAAVERASYQFPWSEGIFRDCVRVGYLCRVVECAGVLIGHGIVSTGAGEAHILNLCVRPEYRCRGIGRQLLRYLLDRSRALGMTETFLEVRPSNTSAIRLYQSFGFEQVGVRRGYYQATHGREDAAVLRLALASL